MTIGKVEMKPSSDDRVVTGIQGLDELLGGGIPKGRIILVAGYPGSGKTIFCFQFLMKGVDEGQGSVYVSLEENKYDICREMAHFGWDLEQMEDLNKFKFLDASPSEPVDRGSRVVEIGIGKPEFTMSGLVERIRKSCRDVNASRLAIDPIASLILRYSGIIERRKATLELMNGLASTGATCLMTTELRSLKMSRELMIEEYLAQGVILLTTVRGSGTVERCIQVEKMRETMIDMQPRPYKITSCGIEVFPKEKVF